MEEEQVRLQRAYSASMGSRARDLLSVSNPEHRHFIDNEWVESATVEVAMGESAAGESAAGERYAVCNPVSGVEFGSFIEAGENEVELAVSAARRAYNSGLWSTYTGAQRAKCMLTFADLLEAKADEISLWDTKSTGVPITTVRRYFYPSCIESFRYYAGYADKIGGESFQEQNGYYDLVQYEPLGVCAGILAWNATIIFLGWKIAPALAAGNTYILKSSEKNPFSTMALAGNFKEAGFPAGVVNFLSGGAKTGQLLASHMDIDKVSFTGSRKIGRKVQDAANGSNMKKVTLELGGKSPAIVFSDAHVETALRGFFLLSGQACFAASRLFVHSSIAEDFIADLRDRFKDVPMDQDPSSDTATMGPLVDKIQFDRVTSYIESGKDDAKPLVGGGYKRQDGYYVQPTIFLNPSKKSRVYRDEIFGPVLTVMTFETEKEAIELANDATYGLSACIYTASLPRALRVARKIEAGTVAINSAFWPGIRVPFGGYKQSGHGRESGKVGLEEYLQAKTIRINMDPGMEEKDA